MPFKQKPIDEKFWRNVTRSEGCWLWSGTKNDMGYGVIFHNFGNGQKQYRAHRISYMLHYGEMPEGAVLMHICDTPLCVNPSHLVAGTQADNLADMHRKGRHVINPAKVRGSASGMAIVNECSVREIRHHYASGGTTYRELAQRYGVSETTIGAIVTRKTWFYVD